MEGHDGLRQGGHRRWLHGTGQHASGSRNGQFRRVRTRVPNLGLERGECRLAPAAQPAHTPRTRTDNATPRVTDRSTRPSSHTTRGPHPDDRAPDYSARCEAPALTAGQRSSGDALSGRGLRPAEALYFEVGQASPARDSVPAPRWLVAQVGIPPPRLAGAMAAVRIGQFAVDRAHVILGLQWFTAPTAQVRRCRSNRGVSRLGTTSGRHLAARACRPSMS